jgi:hypothetical protein
MSSNDDDFRKKWRNIRDNALKGKEELHETYEFEAVNSNTKTIKPNYLSAIAWTAITTFIVCVLFVSAVLLGLDYFGVYDKIATQNTEAVKVLTLEVKKNAQEFRAVKEQSEEMRKKLDLWTPIECLPKKRWKIKGYGLPELENHSFPALDIQMSLPE